MTFSWIVVVYQCSTSNVIFHLGYWSIFLLKLSIQLLPYPGLDCGRFTHIMAQHINASQLPSGRKRMESVLGDSRGSWVSVRFWTLDLWMCMPVRYHYTLLPILFRKKDKNSSPCWVPPLIRVYPIDDLDPWNAVWLSKQENKKVLKSALCRQTH